MTFITQVLLPKRNNLGKFFSREKYVAFHLRMIRRFGGWTRKGQAEGAWLGSSGIIFTDEHWVYEIAHQRRDAQFWQEEKERLKEGFEQEEIWIKVGGYNYCNSRQEEYQMPNATSALVMEKGSRVLFRIKDRIYDLSQEELRDLLGLPDGPPGVGITIDGGRIHFEFATVEKTISENQLLRRLAKQWTAKASS